MPRDPRQRARTRPHSTGPSSEFRYIPPADLEKPGAPPESRGLRGLLSKLKRDPKTTERAPVVYANAQLHRANFAGSDLGRADFHDADLGGADLGGANLEEANLSGADMSGANLCEAILCDADLSGANLRGASLIGADLSGANLRYADLGGAYIWGADFAGADLLGTNLQGAFAGGALFAEAINLSLEQFRSTNHDETGAYRLAMLPDEPPRKGR
jgi:hypothetical protein